MSPVRFEKVEGNIERRLKGMVTRANTVSSYLNRVLLRQFKKAQIERWETENASEGAKWEPLNQAYAFRKRRVFAGYPGGGSVMMMATGRLVSGAQGKDSSYYYKAVTNTSFTFGINVGALPYARFAGDRRPYMRFSTERTREWKRGIREFIIRNKGAV